MTKNLTALALEKGYTVELEPEYFNLSRIGAFRLPLWLTSVKYYISPKGKRYSVLALAMKFTRKARRARLKAANAERKRLLQERELRNENLRLQRQCN